ncbi:MAG: hypothetical protein ABJF10_29515, partial [Chthoniobacter sp.]|uniref:hypothetical protein n=1 Tax=Chthoniobacter sp. TaxID=2510640 RepID=UPI0032A7DFB4
MKKSKARRAETKLQNHDVVPTMDPSDLGEAGDERVQSRQIALMEISYTIGENLRILSELAKDGDALPFNTLVSAIEEGANFVKEITSQHPSVAQTIAAKHLSWPVNITKDPLFPDVDAIRKKLPIGSARVLGFNMEVRPGFKSTTVCREITVISILTIQALSAIREATEKGQEARKLLKQYELFQKAKPLRAKENEIEPTRNMLELASRQAGYEAVDLYKAFAQGLNPDISSFLQKVSEVPAV